MEHGFSVLMIKHPIEHVAGKYAGHLRKHHIPLTTSNDPRNGIYVHKHMRQYENIFIFICYQRMKAGIPRITKLGKAANTPH